MANPLPSPDACSTNQSPPCRCSMAPLKKFIGGVPMKPATNRLRDCRRGRWGGDLLDAAAIHDTDAVAEGHGFDLIVGDVDHGGLQAMMEELDFLAHLDAHLGVEVGERFVEEEGRRLADDGAADGDALALDRRRGSWALRSREFSMPRILAAFVTRWSIWLLGYLRSFRPNAMFL